MSKQKITQTQKKKLLDMISNKPQLRSGKFSNKFTHQQARKEWEEISEILNSIPGAKKEWKAWRKTWQDILSKTKSKSASINQVRRGTGGGPPPPDSLDEFEEGVAALLHPHSISGHAESVESAVIFEEVYIESQAENVELSHPTSLDVQVIDTAVLPPPAEFTDGAFSTSPIPPTVEPPTPINNKPKQTKINMKSLLKEKVNLKKQAMEAKKNFYEAFIRNMERQSKALEDISNTFHLQINQNTRSQDQEDQGNQEDQGDQEDQAD